MKIVYYNDSQHPSLQQLLLLV